jgi:hypothetical protein
MRRCLLSVCLLFCVLFASNASGQASSSLRGKVVDAQGGFMPGVALKVVHAQTAAERSVFSDDTGAYVFPQMAPGPYTISAELPGFATATAKVTLQVDTPSTLDLTMQLAGLAEAVTVEAKVALINTVDATVGNAFNELQVRQLPLMTRNVVELLSLQPGVTPTGEVAGARRDQNNITLDGIDVNDNQTAGMEKPGAANGSQGGLNIGTTRESGFNAALPVPLDSVQEFRVTVSGQNANQGRSSGGQVSLVTKSGTNEFRGSAYEYNRDTKFASNTFFNNRAAIAKEQLKRNQYGASLGGPISPGRIFFFGNVERRTDDSAQAQTRNMPSATLRAGTVMVRATNGQTYALTPDILKALDPLRIGVNPVMLGIMSELPDANDPSLGRDLGLNFSGFRFNAPLTLDNRAYVGKVDIKLDASSRHNLSVRATVADMAEDVALAQFPGQGPASVAMNNSYGTSASYTGVLSPNLVNVANFGLTNIRISQTGVTGPSFGMDSITNPTDFTRPFEREAPTYNFVNDLSWTKGAHNITMGGNLRFIRNSRTNYGNAYPSFSVSRSVALGLGSDITTLVNNYLGATYGSGVRMADANSVQRAMLDLFGVITNGSMNYSYGRDGRALPIGDPTSRTFASNEGELYFGDNWRATPSLTLTYGVRYIKLGVPYETNGLQVGPLFPLQDFFAERLQGMAAGIPSNQLPHAIMQYDFIGPANGKPSWFAGDNNNFAPRVAIAYSPDSGFLSSLTGTGGVIRAGLGMTYDRFGSDLVTKFDNAASFGLSELTRTETVNVTTGARWNGSALDLPAGAAHNFPFTPPEVNFLGGNYMGIDTTLHTPYSFNANLSVARELRGGMSVEAGYIGRWSKDLLMQTDAGGWAILLKDPASGQTWKQMAQAVRGIHDAGITTTQVRANPSLVAPLPWIENMMPALANMFFPGSATANYYDLIWGQFGGSDADAVHAVDRVRSAAFPNCIIKTGCYTLYPQQSSGMSMWTNAGHSDFNGMTLSLRKTLNRGFSFDVNYTLAHARDNGGATEAGGGTGGGIMLNPYDLESFYGDSDFDVRHNVNSNVLFELPFGKGHALLGNAGALTDAIVGGWQISTIFRYRSALPTAVSYTGIWPTNYGFSTLAYAKGEYDAEVQLNSNGVPAIFANPQQAAANWLPMKPGEVGTRAAVRLDDFYNTDLSVTKNFNMPMGQRLQFRAEAFNAFNNVNFTRLSLDANSPATFGQFTATSPARVMQFALRYEF